MMVYIGLQSEFILLALLIKVAVGIWGLSLLLMGRQSPYWTVGSFFMTIGVLIAYFRLGSINYLLVLAAAILILAIGITLYTYIPRAAMAIAHFWPLLAVYGAYRFFEGWLGWDFSIALTLAIAGIVMGLFMPVISLSTLSAALGTIFLAFVLPFDITFAIVLAIFLFGIAWQNLILPRISLIDKWPFRSSGAIEKPLKKALILRSIKIGAAIFAGVFVVMAFLTPQPEIAEAKNPNRLQALAESGKLDQPGFLLSNEDNYYLFDRPLPAALVARENSIFNRLSVLFMGRNIQKDVHQVRAVKEAGELATIRKAAAMTSKAFAAIAPLIQPGVTEAEIEAEIHRVFEENGATGRAFQCIVGAGHNATKPHYGFNNAVMTDGLVVIDIGCSLDNYASDMTRTFPVKGETTKEELELLQIVLTAGDSARAHLRSGAKMSDLHRRAKEVIRDAGFGEYFNHGLGHHVGLNVHDPHIDSLTTGMVITIEPGIYIPAGTSEVDSAYWDLGVRIEDSYIITENGYEEITSFPKIPQSVTAMNRLE